MPGNERFGSLRGGVADAREHTRADGVTDASHASRLHEGNGVIGPITDELRRDPHLFDPPPSNDPRFGDLGELSESGGAWVLSCDDAQTHRLVALLGTTGNVLAAPGGPATVACVSAACGYIEVINQVGGRRGVDINGVVGVPGVIVTPRWGGLFSTMVEVARRGAVGMSILDAIVQMSARDLTLAQTLRIPVVASVFGQVAAGTPVGIALAVGLGFVVAELERALGRAPDINDHGAVMADRGQIGEWESFYIGTVGPGPDDHVAILSHLGYFSAQMGGGAGVYANRPQIGEWERWRMIDNHDGTVSFQTSNGHWLCAEEGGGRECQADRGSIGEWEKFVLVPATCGRFALRTRNGGKYVSVQR